MGEDGFGDVGAVRLWVVGLPLSDIHEGYNYGFCNKDNQ